MKLPLLSSRDLCKFLEKEGFQAIRQKGSHIFYRHLDSRPTTIPNRPAEKIDRGLPNKIIINNLMKVFLQSS